ncbi:MAG: DNA polymerase IV, partial [Oscillospiraceae bacterium]|nr:DNA polymerase IV [Oscillospiraceae bacterium]
MTDRILFHCDCNSFYASVEETFHPVYKAVPMAVAGDPENRRGIILAKNQLAKGYGIQTAETIRSAKQKCPELRLCAPRWRAYGNFSRRINAIYEQYTDLVERFSIDESFLDVTGSLHLFGGDAAALAHEIRQRVEQEIGVTISVGVSWNKIFAKFGSDLKKLNAVTVITRGNYQQIVWPLPVGDLFMVGRTTAAALQSYSIRTIGDLARADADFLRGRFGKFGDMLRLYANGLDNSPVARAGEHGLPKSVGNGLTFRRDLLTLEDIQTGVTALADTVAGRLRRAGLKCCTVQVTIKDTALKSIQRQQPAKAPTWLA